ncbi:MAG: hypothetical protein ACRDKS_10200 [Actinomycetota bacterium]
MAEPEKRRGVVLAGVVGALITAAVILASSGGNLDRMTFGDGELHRAVAADLGADSRSVEPQIESSGPSIRYGRIGFPLMLWAFSGGQPAAMKYVQPMLMVACGAFITVVTYLLLPTQAVAWAVVPFFAVGLTVSLAGGFAEPLAVALGLLGVLLVERSKIGPAIVCIAAAILVRETSVVIVIGLIVWLTLRKSRRHAVFLIASLVPAAIWHVIVALRFGHFPLFDPWLYESDTVGTPVVALIRAVQRVGFSSLVVLAVHLILAISALYLARSSLFGTIALVSGLAMLNVGTNTWTYIGDATRVSVFLEIFVLLAFVRQRLSRGQVGNKVRCV